MPIDNGVFALQSLISEAYCRLEILLEHIQGTIIKPLNGNDKLKMTEHIETLIISGGKAGLASVTTSAAKTAVRSLTLIRDDSFRSETNASRQFGTDSNRFASRSKLIAASICGSSGLCSPNA